MLYITTWNKGQTGKLNSVGAQNVLIITKREITRNNLKKEEKRKEKKTRSSLYQTTGGKIQKGSGGEGAEETKQNPGSFSGV